MLRNSIRLLSSRPCSEFDSSFVRHLPCENCGSSDARTGPVRLEKSNRGGRGGSRRVARKREINQISAQIIDAAMKVRSALAPGLLEPSASLRALRAEAGG
jgi:hypothetical protein